MPNPLKPKFIYELNDGQWVIYEMEYIGTSSYGNKVDWFNNKLEAKEETERLNQNKYIMEQTHIMLVQIPVIKHELTIAGKNVTKRIDELNIEGQIATEETVKALKTLRTTLNNEFTEYENQRKAIKEGVNSPYNEFEAIYKVEVSEKYKSAIDTLKTKIAEVENNVKDNKKESIKSYFVELCLSHINNGIDLSFVELANVGLEINLSTTEKAYKDKCGEFIQNIVDDLKMIDKLEYKAEILAEFKKTLKASKAITEVQDRKLREKQENERIYFTEQNRRKSIVLAHSMAFSGLTNAHEYDNDIYILHDFLEKATKEEFTSKIIEIEELIRAKKQANIVKTEPSPQLDRSTATVQTITQQPSPLKAPTVEVKEETVMAKFQVEAPMAKLRALGQYMKDNGIIYSNIK